jgi:hypothetical protein
VNDVQLTVFAEKTIEKSFISHLVRFMIKVQVGVFHLGQTYSDDKQYEHFTEISGPL